MASVGAETTLLARNVGTGHSTHAPRFYLKTRLDRSPVPMFPIGIIMARYTLTTEDRRKGGKTTAQRHDMSLRARKGFRAFANKYAGGDLELAGKILSKIGNWFTDPSPWNGAFRLPDELPREVRLKLIEKKYTDSDGVLF